MKSQKGIILFYSLLFTFFSLYGRDIYITSLYNATDKSITLMSGTERIYLDGATLMAPLFLRVQGPSFMPSRDNSDNDSEKTISIKLFTFFPQDQKYKKSRTLYWHAGYEKSNDPFIEWMNRICLEHPSAIYPGILSSFNIQEKAIPSFFKDEEIYVQIRVEKSEDNSSFPYNLLFFADNYYRNIFTPSGIKRNSSFNSFSK